MHVLFAVVVVFLILMVSEIWWRQQRPHGELSRKFVHVTVGSFVAFWPYWLTYTDIKFLSAAFVIVVLASRHLHLFQAIHSVQRPTSGELWFALTVGLLAFFPDHPHIYTAALLEMSLADGLAAIVGSRYGNSHRYTIFGSAKTIIGTFTFFGCSAIILVIYAASTTSFSPLGLIIPVALLATAIENLAVFGLDNLFVPLATAGLLVWLS